MRSHQVHSSSYRRALALLLRRGLGLGLLIITIMVVAYWPLQSLLVYLGMVGLVSIGAAVELWEHHRATRGLKLVIMLPPDERSDHDANGSR